MSKKKQEQAEKLLHAIGKKEMEELKLPDSLKPENIKKKILEYEQGSSVIQKTERNQAGMILGIVAACLVLIVGGRNLALSQHRTGSNSENRLTENASQDTSDGAATDDSKAIKEELQESDSDSEVDEGVIPAGIYQASDYVQLLDYCKENGVIVQQEQKEYGYSIVEGYVDAIMDEGEYSLDESSSRVEFPTTTSMKLEEQERDYSETNVQTKGVDEGDIIKTDGTYIYRLSSNYDEIVIYRADGSQIEVAGNIALKVYQGSSQRYCQYYDMLLCDGYLAVLSSSMIEEGREERKIEYLSYGYKNKQQTELWVYDVTNPENPSLVDVRVQEGYYRDVRMVDGIIYLLSYKNNATNYYFDSEEEVEEFGVEDFIEEYIPEVDGSYLSCDCIYLPQQPQTSGFVVMTSTDIHHPEQHLDQVAVMGSDTDLYMGSENIYLWQTEWLGQIGWAMRTSKGQVTTIMKYSYQEGKLKAEATGQVEGYLNNSFSMDEYSGYLRVVTTLDNYRQETKGMKDDGNLIEIEEEPIVPTTKNQLYVLDAALQVVGSIEDLAEGEYVKSARFFGDLAYFVTFRQTDPLFSVDLSNPEKPRILGTLKIPGFSEYLHPFGDGLLLGIGQEAEEESGGTQGVKLSMFDISNPTQVKEVAKCVVRADMDYSNSAAEYDHKAILVSVGKNIIGFPIESGRSSGMEWMRQNEFCVFSYEPGTGFVERITHDFGDWEFQHGSRGIYIGDYLYIVYGQRQVAIYRLSDGSSCGLYDFR